MRRIIHKATDVNYKPYWLWVRVNRKGKQSRLLEYFENLGIVMKRTYQSIKDENYYSKNA